MFPGLNKSYIRILSSEEYAALKKKKKQERDKIKLDEKCKEIDQNLNIFENMEKQLKNSTNINDSELKKVLKNKKEYQNKKKFITTLKNMDEDKANQINLLKASKKSVTNKTLKAIEDGKKADDILKEREQQVKETKEKKEKLEKTLNTLSEQQKEYVAKLKEAGFKLTNSRLNDIYANKDVLKMIQDEEKQINEMISKFTDVQKIAFEKLKASGKKITIKKLSKL